jgi:hypothetical protein
MISEASRTRAAREDGYTYESATDPRIIITPPTTTSQMLP